MRSLRSPIIEFSCIILLKTKKHIFSFGINNKLYKTLTGNVIAVVQDDPAPVGVAVVVPPPEVLFVVVATVVVVLVLVVVACVVAAVAMKIKMTFVKNN